MSGIRAADTPLDVWIDAEWAALCELIGPGEHLTDTWAELTGELVASGSGLDGDTRDPEAVAAVRNLDDDDLARWVPAYARALDDDSDIDLDTLDAAWKHTATFAGGQQALVDAWGNASKSKRKGPSPEDVPVEATDDDDSEFGMPDIAPVRTRNPDIIRGGLGVPGTER